MNPLITPEQRQALDARNGQPIVVDDRDRQQQFVLIAATDHRVRGLLGDSDGDDEWTEQHETRRRELIDKDISGTMSLEERAELAVLDRQGNAHYDRVAPRPIEGVRHLHQELLNKRGDE